MRLLKNPMLAALICLAMVAGCGGGDEPADETVTETTSAEDAAAAPAEPEPELISLPEGFPEAASILPGLEITSAEELDAEKIMYRVTGATTKNVESVLNYYEKYFTDGGWTEDMVMLQPNQAIISFSKDGLLVAVEAMEGGLGCYVTITTGAI